MGQFIPFLAGTGTAAGTAGAAAAPAATSAGILSTTATSAGTAVMTAAKIAGYGATAYSALAGRKGGGIKMPAMPSAPAVSAPPAPAAAIMSSSDGNDVLNASRRRMRKSEAGRRGTFYVPFGRTKSEMPKKVGGVNG